MAALNKTVAGKMKKCYPEMDASEVRPFACVSFTRKSFVYFPDVKMYQEVFLESYIRLVRLNELHLLYGHSVNVQKI